MENKLSIAQAGLIAAKILPKTRSRLSLKLLERAAAAGAEEIEKTWYHIEQAPRDGTLLILVVEYDPDDLQGHALEDTSKFARTIGFNNFDNDGEDRWQLAGWCWSHDHFTEGHGKPVLFKVFADAPKGMRAEGAQP